MPEGTVRFKHHRRELPFLWKLGRRLVCWSGDLEDWLDEQRKLTNRKLDGRPRYKNGPRRGR